MWLNCKVIKKGATPPFLHQPIPPSPAPLFQVYPPFLAKNIANTPKWLREGGGGGGSNYGLLLQTLLFQKWLWISNLLRSLTVDVFPMVMTRPETWFQKENLTILTIKVCMARTFMFPSRNHRVNININVKINMIHICATFCSVVLVAISKLQVK